MKLMFVECITKVQGVSCESDVGIIPVDFTQIQEFFIKLPSIECISILSKFRGSFVKFTFTKVQGSFAKLPSMNCGLISPTFEFFFQNLHPQLFAVGSADPTAEVIWGDVATI